MIATWLYTATANMHNGRFCTVVHAGEAVAHGTVTRV